MVSSASATETMGKWAGPAEMPNTKQSSQGGLNHNMMGIIRSFTRVSQSVASALLIQHPATVFPFIVETQDMHKQDRLWQGSAKLPVSTSQISLV